MYLKADCSKRVVGRRRIETGRRAGEWEDVILRPSHKPVLIALAVRRNSETGRCDPSIPRLAKDTGFTDRHVIDAIEALELAGFIAIERRPDRTNFYIVNENPPRHLMEKDGEGRRRVTGVADRVANPVHGGSESHSPKSEMNLKESKGGGAAPAAPSPSSLTRGEGEGADPARTPSPNLPIPGDLKPAKLTGGADWTPSAEQWQTACATFSPAYAAEAWRDYAAMTARDAKHRRHRASAFGHFMALARTGWPAWEEAEREAAAEAARKHAAERVIELGYAGGRSFGITRGALPTWEAKHPGKDIAAEAAAFRAAVNDLDLDLDLHAGFTRWLAGEGNLMLAEWKARAAAVAREAADGLAAFRLCLRSRPFRPEEPARVRV